MPRVTSLAERAEATARSMIPAPLVPWAVMIAARRKQRDPAWREDARNQMRFVVGEEVTSEALEKAADDYIERSTWRNVSRWRPHLVSRQEIQGLEHLMEARARGRGVILNVMHHGDWEGIWPSLARVGVRCHVISTPDLFRDDAPLWMKQQRKVSEQGGVTLVDVAVGLPGITNLAKQGCVVGIASDIPGHTPMRFLDHEVSCASGAARVAHEGDVPLVILTSHRHPTKPRGGARLRLSRALSPRDFATVQDLLQAMLDRHAEAFREWPEASDRPLRILDHEMVARWKRERDPGRDADTRRSA